MAWTRNRENNLHRAILAKLNEGLFTMNDIIDSCSCLTGWSPKDQPQEFVKWVNSTAIENHVHELLNYDVITYFGDDDEGFFSLSDNFVYPY